MGIRIKLVMPTIYHRDTGIITAPRLVVGDKEFKVTRIVGDFQSPYHKFLEVSMLIDKKDLEIIRDENNG